MPMGKDLEFHTLIHEQLLLGAKGNMCSMCFVNTSSGVLEKLLNVKKCHFSGPDNNK